MLKRLGLEQLIAVGFGLVLVSATIAGIISIRGHLRMEACSAASAKEARYAATARAGNLARLFPAACGPRRPKMH
jgi:hypothetical protein